MRPNASSRPSPTARISLSAPVGWKTRRQTLRQPFYRQFFGRCFNLLTRTVMNLPFEDTQCGFKAFTRRAAQAVFPLQTIDRWGFDPEILFVASKLGFSIREVPVSWAHDARTRMSYFRDGLQMLKELALVRWNALLGRYSASAPAVCRNRSLCQSIPSTNRPSAEDREGHV